MLALSVKTWGIETIVEELYFPRDVIGFLVPGLCMVHDNVFHRIQLRTRDDVEMMTFIGILLLPTKPVNGIGDWNYASNGYRSFSGVAVECIITLSELISI